MDTKESRRSVDSLRPEWWHEVKEIDREEALVLLSLGTTVWTCWYHLAGEVQGVTEPFDSAAALSEPTDLYHVDDCFLDLFYVRKGEPLP